MKNRKLPVGASDKIIQFSKPSKVPSIVEINEKPKKWKAVSFFSGCGGGSTGLKWAGFDVLYANEFVPIAAKTYKANSPSTIVDKRDIRKVTGKQILKKFGLKRGELDLLEGSPPCFIAGTLVSTYDRGYVPIEDIQIGDSVLTHKGRYQKVTSVMRRKYKGTVYKIQTLFGEKVTATPEHPFYIRERVSGSGKIKHGWFKGGVSNKRWRESKDLKVGDYVALGMCKKSVSMKYDGIDIYSNRHRTTKELEYLKTKKTLPVDNKDFWYLMGRWVGDGWVRYHENTVDDFAKGTAKKPRHATYICCDKTDGGVELEQITRRLDRLGLSYRVAEHRTAYRIGIGNKELCKFVLRFGRGAKNKFIPGEVHQLPTKLQRAFLFGYIQADGTRRVTKAGETRVWRFSSISRSLVYGISQIVSRVFGVSCNQVGCNASNTFVIEGRIVNTNPIYGSTFRSYRNEKSHSYCDDHGVVWAPVKQINKSRFRGYVYNLSVDKDETYTANGLVVHNCKGFSNARALKKGDDFGVEVKYSEGIKQRVDDLFFEQVRLINDLKPKVAVLENVDGLANHINRGILVEILDAIEAIGYTVEARILDLSYLGFPQRRKRMIFVCVRRDLVKFGLLPVFPAPREKATVLTDFFPYIERVKIGKGFVSANRPSPCITASDHSIGFTGKFSCGGWIEAGGKYRRFTIQELKRMFGFPDDFRLLGDFIQQWERLGRCQAPPQMYLIARKIVKEILIPWKNR